MATIDISTIIPNPQQPRTLFDEESIAALSDSLKEDGLLNPISVIGPIDGVYVLEDGERRLRAAKLAGWAQIEASVKSPNGNVNDVSLLMHALIGNLQREDMGPIDEGRAYERLQTLGLAQAEIARRVGRSQPHVSSRIRMLGMPDEVQDLFNRGLLPIHQEAICLLRKLPEEQMIRAAKRAALMKFDSSRIIRMCSRMMGPNSRTNNKAMIRALRSNDMPALSMNLKIVDVSPSAVIEAVRAECKFCGMADDLKLCLSCPLLRMVGRLTKDGENGK